MTRSLLAISALAAVSLASAVFAQGNAEVYNGVRWVKANGQRCDLVCRNTGKMLAIATLSSAAPNMPAYICRGTIDNKWTLPGYNGYSGGMANDNCLIAFGDGKTAGTTAAFDCLCGR